MTKQRIKLTNKQIQQQQARAVKRATNGAIAKCYHLVKERLKPFMTSDSQKFGRCLIPISAIIDLKREITELRL